MPRFVKYIMAKYTATQTTPNLSLVSYSKHFIFKKEGVGYVRRRRHADRWSIVKSTLMKFLSRGGFA